MPVIFARERNVVGGAGNGGGRREDGMGWQGDFAFCENMRVGAGE